MKIIDRYKISAFGLCVALSLFLISAFCDLDLFELLHETLSSLEHYEIDEFIIPIFVFFLFVFFDFVRRQKKTEIEYEKAKIYNAMLTSTHHILNNFINQMAFFKDAAEDSPEFNAEILQLYDEVIQEASGLVDALGHLTHIDEEAINESVYPKGNLCPPSES